MHTKQELELRTPEKHEFPEIREKCKLTPDEEAYWKKLEATSIPVAQGGLDFLLKEFKSVKDGGSIGIKRRLSFIIGKLYEEMGTRIAKTPSEKYPCYENAVAWYHKADELIGYFTDYTIRQSEVCAAAAYNRFLAGLHDEKTEWYTKRRHALLRAFFGDNPITLVTALTSDLKKIVNTEKEMDIAGTKVYFTKEPKKMD